MQRNANLVGTFGFLFFSFVRGGQRLGAGVEPKVHKNAVSLLENGPFLKGTGSPKVHPRFTQGEALVAPRAP